MNDNTTKRRDYIKNALIVFLILMLVLTFFSNTIMNYSLPEVSAQYSYGGSISAKVRASGSISADDPYSVIVDETRTVASVLVREGDTVEKGQVIMMLEPGESTEYELALEELQSLEDAFYKALLSESVSVETTDKVQSGTGVNVSSYEAQIKALKNEITALEADVKVYEDEITYYEYHLALAENAHTDVSTETDTYNSAVSARKTAESNLTTIANKIKANSAIGITTVTIDAVNAKKTVFENEVSNTQSAIDAIYSSSAYITAEAKKAGYEQAVETAKADLEALISDPESASGGTVVELTVVLEKRVDDAITALDTHVNSSPYTDIEKLESTKATNQAVVDLLASYVTAYNALESAKSAESTAKSNLNSAGTDYSTAISDYKNSIAVYEVNKADVENQLTIAQTALSDLVSSLSSELDLTSSLETISKKQEEIAQLQAKAMGEEVEAPISGIIQDITVTAGQDVTAGVEFAMIQPTGNGFTMEVSVTSLQAMGLSKGDVADVQNSWYYSNITAVLSDIKVDADSKGANKILVFEVEGDVSDGQSLSISIGQKSQEYSNLVPNSAIREDNNGKFVLTVVQKSSPLGNRYYAERVDVEVLASDDTQSAVSGAFYGGEFVITTSTKPVEAGQLVRLAD